jgi:hypothetical protein
MGNNKLTKNTIILTEEWEIVNWVGLVQDGNKKTAPVNAAVKLWVP